MVITPLRPAETSILPEDKESGFRSNKQTVSEWPDIHTGNYTLWMQGIRGERGRKIPEDAGDELFLMTECGWCFFHEYL